MMLDEFLIDDGEIDVVDITNVCLDWQCIFYGILFIALISALSSVVFGAVPICEDHPIFTWPNANDQKLILADTPKDNGSLIDVMKIWTPAAEVAIGGEVKMRQFCSDVIADENLCLINSKIPFRFRLVFAGRWDDHVEFENYNDELYGFINSATFISNRENYRADLGQLICELPNAAIAGSGFLMTNLNNAFRQWSGSIARRRYALSFHTSAHEDGHNFGNGHNIPNASFVLFPYSHGYLSVNYGTVMAYVGAQLRLPVYSNGGRFLIRAPSGTWITLGDKNCDNAQSMTNAAFTVANFSISKDGATWSTSTPNPVQTPTPTITPSPTPSNIFVMTTETVVRLGTTVSVTFSNVSNDKSDFYLIQGTGDILGTNKWYAGTSIKGMKLILLPVVGKIGFDQVLMKGQTTANKVLTSGTIRVIN